MKHMRAFKESDVVRDGQGQFAEKKGGGGSGNASFLARFSKKIGATDDRDTARAKVAAAVPPAKKAAPVKVAGPSTLPKRATVKTNDASVNYRSIVGDEAVRLHAQAMRGRPWTPEQRRAVQRYTGDDYREINGFLRTGRGGASARADADSVRAAMREIPEDIMVFRAVSATGFGYPNKQAIPASALPGLVGRTWSDPGFTSTSINSEPYDYNAKVRMRISVPKGTRGVYVDTVSENQDEEEMLLDAGTQYRIDRIEQDDRGITTMHMTVVNQSA